MEELQLFAEILKYILPALAVLAGVWLTQKNNLTKELQKEGIAVRAQALQKIVPLRLQAYERAILFLERISPENLLTRSDTQSKTSGDLRLELISSIRAEYEHNLAQQLYISLEGWAELVKAKENVIALVNEGSKSVPPKTPAIDFARRLIQIYREMDESPVESAIQFLKTDLQKSFRMIK